MKTLKPRAKFIAICAAGDNEYRDRIYALDADGLVWGLAEGDAVWTRLPVKQRNFEVVRKS